MICIRVGLTEAVLNQFGDATNGREAGVLHLRFRKLHAEPVFQLCYKFYDLQRTQQAGLKIVDFESFPHSATDFAARRKPIHDPTGDFLLQSTTFRWRCSAWDIHRPPLLSRGGRSVPRPASITNANYKDIRPTQLPRPGELYGSENRFRFRGSEPDYREKECPWRSAGSRHPPASARRPVRSRDNCCNTASGRSSRTNLYAGSNGLELTVPWFCSGA